MALQPAFELGTHRRVDLSRTRAITLLTGVRG